MDFGKPLRKGKYQKFSRRDFLLIICLVHSNLGFPQVNSYLTFLRDLLVQFTSCITALLGLEKDKNFFKQDTHTKIKFACHCNFMRHFSPPKAWEKKWFGIKCGKNYRKVLLIAEQGQDKVNDAPGHENLKKRPLT